MLGPVVAAARLSIVGAKQQASRSLDRPLYQRRLLDVLLLAAAVAGFYLLRSVDALPGETEDDLLLADTLLILAPILFIFAVSVFALRAFPYARARARGADRRGYPASAPSWPCARSGAARPTTPAWFCCSH